MFCYVVFVVDGVKSMIILGLNYLKFILELIYCFTSLPDHLDGKSFALFFDFLNYTLFSFIIMLLFVVHFFIFNLLGNNEFENIDGPAVTTEFPLQINLKPNR